MTKLSVNINKIALLRNARSLDLNLPDVCEAARVIIKAGAAGITVHPRPDQRHIRYDDAYTVSKMIRSEFEATEYNIEGNPFTGKYMDLVTELKPDQATLVPDQIGANTSDHGWQLTDENIKRLEPVIKNLKKCGIRVSLFIDPKSDPAVRAAQIGADRVELYTEPYATAFRKMVRQAHHPERSRGNENLELMLEKYKECAEAAKEAGLLVNAGHDLNLNNLGLFCNSVPNIAEVSIGHALIAEALYGGLEKVIKQYLKILSKFKG
jgi:pyridoxine 5-phosphate synthase